MQAIDFSRSFVTFVMPGRANNARIQVEARCELIPGDGSPAQEYLLVASCKAEETFAPANLFKQPNYDFCAIFSADRYRIVRVPLIWDETMQEAGESRGRFEDVVITVRRVPATPCATVDAIVAATLRDRPLVARTELCDAATGMCAVLEYPVKTMNAHEAPPIFQVDTGPVLLPDFAAAASGRAIEGARLAYVAFNTFDWAEFIVAEPTPVGTGEARLLVAHYSAVSVLPARSELLALD
jgi:hypothetical protein